MVTDYFRDRAFILSVTATPVLRSRRKDKKFSPNKEPTMPNIESHDETSPANRVRDYVAEPRNLARLHRVVSRILPHEAQDAVQDGIVAALGSSSHFDGRSSLSTWMHRVVVNAALMRLRKSRTANRYLDVVTNEPGAAHWLTGEGEAPALGEHLEHKSRSQALTRAVQALPSVYKEATTSFLLQDVDVESAAARLGVGVACLRARAGRARKMLMTSLLAAA